MSVLTTNLKKFIIWYKFGSILALVGASLMVVGIIGVIFLGLKTPILFLLIIPYIAAAYYCIWYALTLSKCVKTLKSIAISNYIVSLETLASEQAKIIRAQGILLIGGLIISVLSAVGILATGVNFGVVKSVNSVSSSSSNSSSRNNSSTSSSNNSGYSSSSEDFSDSSANESVDANESDSSTGTVNSNSSTPSTTSVYSTSSSSTKSSSQSSSSSRNISSFSSSSSSTPIDFN